jgi:hypothetical protein
VKKSDRVSLDRLHYHPSCFVPRHARDEEAQHEAGFIAASRGEIFFILSVSKDETAASTAAIILTAASPRRYRRCSNRLA